MIEFLEADDGADDNDGDEDGIYERSATHM